MPITAAIVIASGMKLGMHRVVEVLFGCVVGIAVAWVLSRVWPLLENASATGKQGAA